jgi:hypothetical protein
MRSAGAGRRPGWAQPLGLTAAALACVLAMSSCQQSGLHFKAPNALRIVRPGNLATVRLPFVVVWSAGSTGPPPPSGTGATNSYAVFIDTPPMPPGETVQYFARGDPSCQHTAGCPNASYLRNKNVFLTSQRRLVVPGLADTRPTGRKSSDDRHQITIIPLGPGGRRIGDGFYTITVFVNRQHSGSLAS